MKVYEVFTKNEYIGAMLIEDPSLSVFQSFLKDLGFKVTDNDVPLVDTKENWYLEDLKYHFKLIN